MCGKHVVATRFIAALVLCLGLASCGTTLHDPVAVSGTSGGGNDTAALDAGDTPDVTPGVTTPDAASGAPGGVARNGGGATAPGTRPVGGANTSPISIGFVVTETGNASSLGINVGQTFSHRQAVEALVRALNAQGGLAGRKIQPVIDATDTASVSWEADYASSCAAFRTTRSPRYSATRSRSSPHSSRACRAQGCRTSPTRTTSTTTRASASIRTCSASRARHSTGYTQRFSPARRAMGEQRLRRRSAS